MKRLFIMAAMAVAALTASAKGDKAAKDTALFNVEMHCQKCVDRITNEMTYVKGVTDLKVSLEDKTVWVEYKNGKVNRDELLAKLRSLGYEVKEESKAHQCSSHCQTK